MTRNLEQQELSLSQRLSQGKTQLAARFRMLLSTPLLSLANSWCALSVGFFSAPLKRLTLNRAQLPIDELKTATSVDLSGKHLQHTDAIIIASLMSMVNTPLTTLVLAGNEIGVEGAKAIAGALPR